MKHLSYSVHAYAWTTQWSNNTLDLIDRAKGLGFDSIEIPLMEIELVDPIKIKERLQQQDLNVCTSLACSESTDITSAEENIRKQGVAYLKKCVQATADMGGTCMTGVIYSAIGRKIDGIPDERYWNWSASALKEVAVFARDLGITLGIEAINRYETFLINTCDQALRLKDLIDEPNVKVHLDAYHMNIEEDNFYDPTKKAVPDLCHFHLSESHRGTPGTGTVDWDQIYKALADGNYRGLVGLESFEEVADNMRAATCMWRKLAPSSDVLLRDGLAYLKGLEIKYFNT